MNLAFDTLTAAKKMEEVGMERVQAEAISHIIAERQGDLVTKADIADMATKADIADMATKADIADMATKADIADMATKADIANMATKADIAILKADIANCVTKAEFAEKFAEVKGDIKTLSQNVRTYWTITMGFMVPLLLMVLAIALGVELPGTSAGS